MMTKRHAEQDRTAGTATRRGRARPRHALLVGGVALTGALGGVLAGVAPANAAPDEWVSPDDGRMSCSDGVLVDCEVKDYDVKSSEEINLPPEKVTESVAGCTPGNQPTIGRTLSYAKGTTVGVGGGVDLGNLPGGGNAFGPLKDAVSVGVDFTVTETVTYGDAQTMAVQADYGMVSYGQFAQRAVRTVGDLFVYTEDNGEFPASYEYGAHDVVVTTPLERGETGLPQGTLATYQRPFESLAEFEQLCGTSDNAPEGLV